MKVLHDIRDPKTGEPVVEWIKERGEVVAGASIEKYPAVLFKLKADYGVDFGLYGGLFAPDVNHRRISGGHRPTGVFGSSMAVDPPDSIEQFHNFVVGLLDRYAGPARQ
jgi:hypothetical protein